MWSSAQPPLSEVGELTPAARAKLLRALENGEVQRVGSLTPRKVDVAVVAATNRDLRAEVLLGARWGGNARELKNAILERHQIVEQPAMSSPDWRRGS